MSLYQLMRSYKRPLALVTLIVIIFLVYVIFNDRINRIFIAISVLKGKEKYEKFNKMSPLRKAFGILRNF